jgi:hypothetical protein
MATVLVRAPYLPSDTMVGTKGYQVYQISGGVLGTIGGRTTAGFVTIPNVTNGFMVNVTVTPNQADGSFTGIIVFDGFNDPLNNTHAALELYLPRSSNQVNVSICKIAPFVSTDLVAAPGYQMYDTAGLVVGGHVTLGILAIPNVVNGYVTQITGTADAAGGLQRLIVWDDGNNTPAYFDDYLTVLPPAASISSGGGGGSFDTVIEAFNGGFN